MQHKSDLLIKVPFQMLISDMRHDDKFAAT